ncbi:MULTISPECIES: hypothetical protein [Rhizobium/Agrobacterium group]|uniref:hypothetical protein n=1 Tax=Rhizobium/Agrobacterium group TaxID=227290 RepID=UPI001E326E06|nr:MULTISPECIES: hypothetical protein [Rhizobium/Agrobacterium group]
MNEVADFLGHRSINTTAVYVKVAASQLAEVALPFREALHDRLCPIPRREGGTLHRTAPLTQLSFPRRSSP